ncbi:hypothetical protein Sar04_03750 [Salinispora arenicola]|uniref:Uncharacterized protein n=1 Tax=Salinispora arenicola TaxID=168697 RepID=A0ABQ4JNP2_SALAC|nr:hypothetical protein Sar04_03750 [Salinispora arenicola]
MTVDGSPPTSASGGTSFARRARAPSASAWSLGQGLNPLAKLGTAGVDESPECRGDIGCGLERRVRPFCFVGVHTDMFDRLRVRTAHWPRSTRRPQSGRSSRAYRRSSGQWSHCDTWPTCRTTKSAGCRETAGYHCRQRNLRACAWYTVTVSAE